MAQRPTLITIICILMAIVGILTLIGGVTMLLVDATWAGTIDLSPSLVKAFGAYSAAVGLLTLIVAFLLWTGNKIGWYLAIIVLALNAISSIFQLPTGVVTIIVMVILIWYFFRPNVKEFYGV